MKNSLIILFLIPFHILLAQIPGAKYLYTLDDKTYLCVQICSPSIIRVRTSQNGQFPQSLLERYGIVQSTWPAVRVDEWRTGDSIELATDSLRLHIDTGSGALHLLRADGGPLISSIRISTEESVISPVLNSLSDLFGKEVRHNAIIGDTTSNLPASASDKNQANTTSLISVELQPMERFYGLGSACRGRIQHRGYAARIWAQYQLSESPAPFIMSTSGWGLFNNTTRRHYFDIGRFDKDKMFVTTASNTVDFYLMTGHSMQDVLARYTDITGKPYLLPKYAYGFAFGSNTMENQFDVMNNAIRFREEKIPIDIYWLEPQWMSQYYDFSTSKNWDLKKFPAEYFWLADKYPKFMAKSLFVGRLHDLGFKLALWLCIDHDLSIWEEDSIAVASGKPVSGREHWFKHLTRFMDQGVKGFKLDPGRTLDEHPDRNYYNGLTDADMHMLNQVLLPKQMLTAFKNHTGLRSFHHYCGGYAGIQHWGGATCGDNGGGRVALYDQLNHGLSANMNTSCDILTSVDDNIQGMHFGFFLPWVQLNSWADLLHPWYFVPREKEAFRFYAQLRYSLMPYIYSHAIHGSQTGMPILRAMPLIYPDDPVMENIGNQYMFGENLLVGIFTDSLQLPAGTWVDFWSNEKITGGRKVKCNVPPDKGGPLFIKSGAIIPFQQPMDYVDEFPGDTLILKVYPQGRSDYTLLEDDGVSFKYQDGAVAATTMSCIAEGRTIRLNISKRQGRYDNMPEHRVYLVELFSLMPKKLIVNNIRLADKDVVFDKKMNRIKFKVNVE
jgi:alpha-glucosidase